VETERKDRPRSNGNGSGGNGPNGNGSGGKKPRPSLITDVARLANVSTATVSRVINTPDAVAPGTAERVREAMESLNYRPNIFAKGLITKSSKVLGIILPDLMGEFFSQLLQSADRAARDHGYHVVVTSDTRLGSSDAVQSLPLNFLDGVIALLTFPDRKLTQSLLNLNMPTVLIDPEKGITGADQVWIDNEPGTREATEHLLESIDPSDCFYVGGPATNFDATARADVFKSVLSEHSHTVDRSRVFFGDYSVDWGNEWASKHLPGRTGATTGVLAGNDEIALGVLNAAASLGIDAPNQLRVVGFDGTRLCDIVRPTLSSVSVPFDYVGTSAIELCIARIADPGREPQVVRAETRLQVRDSSVPNS